MANIFKEIAEWFEAILHPAARESLATAAAYLTENKAELVAAAGTAGVSAETFLVNTTVTFMNEHGLGGFVAIVQPLMMTFLEKEIGYGSNDIGTLIDKLAAWLVAEEANV